MGRLEGKVAIVTGGGTGIGRETAKMLAAEGALVVICGRRKPPLEAVVTEIERTEGRAVARQADLENPAEARALGEWTLATYGRVDVLVNNAGHSSERRSVRWITQEEWDSVIAVNVTGVYALTQTVLPNMIDRGSGTIVTVASLAAIRAGMLSGAAYGAAKAAVRNLMGQIHATLRNRGIRATTIMPAAVNTEILDQRPRPPTAEERAMLIGPEDVAAAVLLAVTLPERTVIEEIVMSPRVSRDQGADMEAALRLGEPGWTPP